MEDGLPSDLDFAGHTGKGIFGAQAAHVDLVVVQSTPDRRDRPWGVAIDDASHRA
jgi:hypothetical protein